MTFPAYVLEEAWLFRRSTIEERILLVRNDINRKTVELTNAEHKVKCQHQGVIFIVGITISRILSLW